MIASTGTGIKLCVTQRERGRRPRVDTLITGVWWNPRSFSRSHERSTRATTNLALLRSLLFPQRTQWQLSPRRKAEVGGSQVSLSFFLSLSEIPVRPVIACPNAEHPGKEISVLCQILPRKLALVAEHHRSFAVDGRRHAARHAPIIDRIRSRICPRLCPGLDGARKSTETHNRLGRHSDDSFQTVDREVPLSSILALFEVSGDTEPVTSSTIRKSVTGLCQVDGTLRGVKNERRKVVLFVAAHCARPVDLKGIPFLFFRADRKDWYKCQVTWWHFCSLVRARVLAAPSAGRC